jgi:hypothetical protein
MAETRRDGIDTRDFGEILAALCEIARDAGRAEQAAEAQHEAIQRIIMPALTPGERQ